MTTKWYDLQKKERRCLDFRKVSWCDGRVELQVRNAVDYLVTINPGDIEVRVIPTYRVMSIQHFQTSELGPEGVEEVRFAASAVAGRSPEEAQRYDAPPSVYPEEAKVLWHATSPLAREKLYRWCQAEGANEDLQRTQLLELFNGLDIFDSDDPVTKGPWQGEGEELWVPQEFRSPLSPTVSAASSGMGGAQTAVTFSPSPELGGREETSRMADQIFADSESSEENASA